MDKHNARVDVCACVCRRRAALKRSAGSIQSVTPVFPTVWRELFSVCEWVCVCRAERDQRSIVRRSASSGPLCCPLATAHVARLRRSPLLRWPLHFALTLTRTGARRPPCCSCLSRPSSTHCLRNSTLWHRNPNTWIYLGTLLELVYLQFRKLFV